MFEIFLCICAAFVTFNIWRCTDHLEDIADILSNINDNVDSSTDSIDSIANSIEIIEGRGEPEDNG